MKRGTKILLAGLIAVFAAGFAISFATVKIENRYAGIPEPNNCFITQVKWECGECDAPIPDGYYAGGWPIRFQKKLIKCGDTKEKYLQTGRFMLNGLFYSLVLFPVSALTVSRLNRGKK